MDCGDLLGVPTRCFVAVDPAICSSGRGSRRSVRMNGELGGKLLEYNSLRRDFVPFLLNFLREQTNQLIPNGPSTPAKTSSVKGLKPARCHRDWNESNQTETKGSYTETPKGTRVQLFLDTPNSSSNLGSSFKSPSSNGGTFFSKSNSDLNSIDSSVSPDFSSGATSRYGERRSAQRASLGQFIVQGHESQSQRRARKKNMLVSGRHLAKDTAKTPAEDDAGTWNGNKRRIEFVNTTPPAAQLNINNLEEFPPVGAVMLGSKTKPSRRINPTPVSVERLQSKPKICFTSIPLSQPLSSTCCVGAASEAFGAGLEGFAAVSSPSSLQEEREMLKIERSKLLQQSVVFDSVPPTKCQYGRSSSTPSDSIAVCADISKVSYRSQLDILAQLYSACISENLVPNIFLELFFILQLLTSRGGASTDDLEDKVECSTEVKDVERQYFRSVHNCTYFAVRVLETQFTIISYLDKGTVRLLSENDRLGAFSASLRERLTRANEVSAAQVSLALPSVIQSVPFEPETDNRSNFTSDRAFQSFKKQRDVFYELLREWEDKHADPGWEFERALGLRIRNMMVNLSTACNHNHFARLFQKQLIRMCKGIPGALAGSEHPDQDVLDMFGTDNLTKLKRLQERFVVPQSTGGPCPPPSFSGCQLFFRDFLLCAGSHQLNQHLSDTLCQQILELDGIGILSHGSSEHEADVDEQDEKEHFASVLMTARLLAKFLGFLAFLPYRTDERPTKEMQEAALSLRNKSPPVLDVYRLLRKSVENQRIIFTVPWLVEFLSMVDHVASFLDYYRSVFTLLLHLYRSLVLTSERNDNFLNKMLILAVLGWLFQIPALPEEMFFNEENVDGFEISISDQGLDSVPLVDQQLLYLCCPYLSELRKLLASYVAGSGLKNGGYMRKITPTAAEPSLPTLAQSQQKLQVKLEEAFFHNQPPSLRKTVEFVAERVGSNCVKHIKASLVPELVKRGTTKLQNAMKNEKTNLPELLESVICELCEEGRQAVIKGREFCTRKGPEVIRVLLPGETSASVLSTAEGITSRLATEKACTWLSANITALIRKEMKLNFDKLRKSQMVQSMSEVSGVKKNCSPECKHTASPPSQIASEFKVVLSITLGPRYSNERVDHKQLDDLLRRLRQTLRCRQYMCPVIEQSLAKYTVELASLLVGGEVPLSNRNMKKDSRDQPSLCKSIQHLLSFLLTLWKDEFCVPIPFQLIFSEKNISYTIEARNRKLCWNELLFLIHGLTEQGLMKPTEIESCWRDLLRKPWPEDFVLVIESILGMCSELAKMDKMEEQVPNKTVVLRPSSTKNA
ncbi:codanin-1 isoform X2 [Stegostoma tigrinum]|uniref:codanin-1 isoform X2 n=1 Tax=Stegostoma tigrinum TaxID=3053191 RepID=UPI00286FB695|nr:codanin-1 isoform X2 [Stegostoma tigrinum]